MVYPEQGENRQLVRESQINIVHHVDKYISVQVHAVIHYAQIVQQDGNIKGQKKHFTEYGVKNWIPSIGQVI